MQLKHTPPVQVAGLLPLGPLPCHPPSPNAIQQNQSRLLDPLANLLWRLVGQIPTINLPLLPTRRPYPQWSTRGLHTVMVMVNLGTQSGKVIIKVARTANTQNTSKMGEKHKNILTPTRAPGETLANGIVCSKWSARHDHCEVCMVGYPRIRPSRRRTPPIQQNLCVQGPSMMWIS